MLSDAVGKDLNFFFLYKVLRGEPSGKAVVVKIDNASLDALQRSDLRVLNLSKTVFSDLLERLYADGAKTVALDVVFANRSPDEGALAAALSKYPQTVIAAKIGVRGDSERILPLDSFSGARWGSVDVLFDKNVVSKVQPVLFADGRSVEPLSFAAYRAYLGDGALSGSVRGDTYVFNPVRKIPLLSDGSALIPFFYKPFDVPSYSLSDVLSGKIPKGTFEGRAVFVGEYGTLIHDAHFSPVDFGRKMPGVEFHANVFEGLLSGKFLASAKMPATASACALLALVSVAMFAHARVIWSIAYAAAVAVFALISGWTLLSVSGIVTDFFALLVAGVFLPLPLGYVYRYFVVNKERHLIESAFAHYIAPEVVSKIADNPENLKLGGEKRRITVFFSDIAGFTTISETLGTVRLFALIGEYLSQMTDILIQNKGTLDKYIGDAVMGFFGAPLKLDHPESLACRTALEQQARLRMLRTKWKREGIPPVAARIGIHCGEAMVGNVGSKNRFNYTAMGDTVNLASRLEGVNKEYGTFICVSEDVKRRVEKEFVFRELDTIKVKGKTEGVKIFELLGFADDPYLDVARARKYEEALAVYRSGNFPEAKRLFEANPYDLPSIHMARRCDDLIAGKTTLKDGVYQMETK